MCELARAPNPYARIYYYQLSRRVTAVRDYFVCCIIVIIRFLFFWLMEKNGPCAPSFHDIDKLSLIRRPKRLNRRRQYRERVSEPPADEWSGWNSRGDGVGETTMYTNVVVVCIVYRGHVHSYDVDR